MGRPPQIHPEQIYVLFSNFTSSLAPLCLAIPTVLSHKSASFLTNAYTVRLVYWLVSKLRQASSRHSQLFERDSLSFFVVLKLCSMSSPCCNLLFIAE